MFLSDVNERHDEMVEMVELVEMMLRPHKELPKAGTPRRPGSGRVALTNARPRLR